MKMSFIKLLTSFLYIIYQQSTIGYLLLRYKNLVEKGMITNLNCIGFKKLVSVEVYDNTLPANSCLVVDNEAKLAGIGHTVFNRKKYFPRSLVEKIIDSILNSLNDTSTNVEYWWRDQWISLELHRDVDEVLAAEQNIFRFPNNAHVLYLSVGKDVHGPTIVFHETLNNNNNSYINNSNDNNSNNNRNNGNIMTIVPAVEGRLLKFSGDLLHAVPRPSLAYLDPSEGGSNNEIWTRKRPNLEDPENDPELTIYRRSVLLFNTWSDNEEPLNISSNIPSIIESAYINDKSIIENIEINSFEKWQKIDINNNTLNDNNYSNSTDNNDNNKLVRLKIGLLGTMLRRQRSDRYINLLVSNNIKDSLISDNKLPNSFITKERI